MRISRFPWKSAVIVTVVNVIAAGCSHASSLAPDPGGLAAGASSSTAQEFGARTMRHRSGTTPDHVLTWQNIGANGGPNISPTLIAQWVNYATADQADSIVAHDLGIKTSIYTDPNRTGPGDLMHTAHEGTYAHDCNGHRIGVIGKDKQLMNVHSDVLWAEWPAAVLEMELWNGGGIYDYIFEDTADSIYNTNATPCNFDQQTWTDDTNTMDTVLGMPIIYNGLSHVGTTGNPADVIQINPTTQGGEGEECYIGRTPTGYHYEMFWIGMENTEIAMQEQNRLFDCTGTASGDAAQNTALRTYQYASFLLTYDLNTSIMESRWTTPSGVSVMPETLLVPQAPLVQTPSNISGLLQSSGVYGREYGSCYIAGTLVGACAVAVNSNNPKAKAPMAFPWPGKYNHTLTMSGEDLYDGGTVGTNGPAPPALMAGGVAVIAFP